jgi:lactoylglutathione lyase
MFKFNGMDHLNLMVKNIDETVNFYNKVFNFEIKEEGISQKSGNRFAIIGRTNKGMLCIYEDLNFDNTSSNLGHIGFNIDYKEGMIKYLKENDIKVIHYQESGVVNYPESSSIYIEDPNGYEIELSSNFGGGL